MKKLITVMVLIGLFTILMPHKAKAIEGDPFKAPTKIRCTCYCDSGVTSSGAETREGIIASKKEWQGYCACLYSIAEDGSIGEFIGFYEILDTGYGRETGIGESKIFKGRTLGTIESGETIDVYMPTLHQAEEWIDTYGDYVYLFIVKGEG